MSHTIPVVDRLLRRIEIDPVEACWHWTGRLDEGYGQIKVGGQRGRTLRVHRVAYELWTGPIPEGLTIDHLCHTRACESPGPKCPHRSCFNPDHLEAVSTADNTRRSALGAAKPWVTGRPRMDAACGNGHPRTEANTLMHLRKDGYLVRVCRPCRNERRAAWMAKQKKPGHPPKRMTGLL